MRIGSGGRPPDRPVKLNNCILTWQQKVKHLGNVVTSDLLDSADITFKKGVFVSQVNKLNCKFSSLHCSMRARLFQTYCCSFYGCQTWDLDSKSVQALNTEWNKAVRRTLLLPFKTRTKLLPHLILGNSFILQHKSRISKFLATFQNSRNSHVAYIGVRASYYAHGPIGRNHTRCRGNVGVDEPGLDLLARSHVIRELLDVRDGLDTLSGFTHEDISLSIDYLCTM